MMLKSLDIIGEKNENQLLPHSIPKSQPEMVIELNVKARTTKFLGENL